MIDSTGFTLHNMAEAAFPILLSVPHAGRDYPQSLLDNLRVHPGELVRLEDRYADRLVQQAIHIGLPAIVAQKARAWIDLNRSERDIDRDMLTTRSALPCFEPSPKTRGGLGLIPRRLSGCGDLWQGLLDYSDIETRISNHHRPYHDAIEASLFAMRERFGVAVLLDVHSMPPLTAPCSQSRAQIVIGDHFGKSAASWFSECVLAVARNYNVEPALNHPYPGDYTLRRHGKLRHNIHAIQLEVDRSLYLDDVLREPTEGLSSITSLITEIAVALSDQAGWAMPIAAE